MRVSVYAVPNVTSNDTFDTGSTGTNDYTKMFLALQVGLTNSALAVTTMSNATNLVMSQAGLTGEDAVIVCFGAST